MTTMSQQQTEADARPAARLANWAPLAVILCGTFVYILDFFVVNVALPDIQHSLGASAPRPSSGWSPATRWQRLPSRDRGPPR